MSRFTNQIITLFTAFLICICGCKKSDVTDVNTSIDPTTQPSELSRAFKVENGSNQQGNAPAQTTASNLLITKFQPTALITADNYLFIPFIGQTSETVNGVYFQVVGADNYWVVNTSLSADKSQVIRIEIPANVLNGDFEVVYGLKGVNGGIGKPINLKAEVISPIEYCSNGRTPQLIQGEDGLVCYSFDFGDKVGWITIDYETFTIPDRIDVRYNKEWVASTGRLLSGNPPTKLCSSVTNGDGFVGDRDNLRIYYDGRISRKVDVYVSGCLDGGTKWEFKVKDCPTVWYSGLPDCPCTYAIARGLGKTTSPAGEWKEGLISTVETYHYGAAKDVRWEPAVSGWPGQQCTYDANGKLITGGIAAGSPDKVSPKSISPEMCMHNIADVVPWGGSIATCSNGNAQPVSCWEYLTGWPANKGVGCSNNVVTGIAHMQTMIGKMTCEQATTFIKGAKESTSIDPQLKNYILGSQATAPPQLKEKLKAWRATLSLCDSFLPSSLCKVIDIAISNV